MAVHLQLVHNTVSKCGKIGENWKESKQKVEKQKKAETKIIGIGRGVIRVRIVNKNLLQLAVILNQIEI